MKLILSVNFFHGDKKIFHAMLTKEFETDLIPVAGMYIDDIAWSDSREITSVTLNLIDEKNYFVTVSQEEHSSIKDCDTIIEGVYHPNGWE